MLTRLYNLLAMIAIATMLASGGFVGFLFGSGRLSGAKLQTVAAALRGELVRPPEQTGAADAQATSQPTSQPAGDARENRGRDFLAAQVLERAKRDVEARQRLLDQTLQNLLTERERLTEQQTVVSEGNKKRAAADVDSGSKREVEFVAGLAPAQAKEHILRLWKKQPAEAVRLFMQLDVGKGKRILAQMKTPEELEMMSQLLEQLRLQDSPENATASGTTAGDASP